MKSIVPQIKPRQESQLFDRVELLMAKYPTGDYEGIIIALEDRVSKTPHPKPYTAINWRVVGGTSAQTFWGTAMGHQEYNGLKVGDRKVFRLKWVEYEGKSVTQSNVKWRD